MNYPLCPDLGIFFSVLDGRYRQFKISPLGLGANKIPLVAKARGLFLSHRKTESGEKGLLQHYYFALTLHIFTHNVHDEGSAV